ncbi:MAG: major outer membrane protein, partial [Campylobacter sp.]|nr:major outer membrane protein [Campylobacter sp.]
MKRISFVLCSALFLASNSFATPLDEAIKDIDVSGELRYRYDSAAGNFWNKRGFEEHTSAVLSRQEHKWAAGIGFDAAIADNFKAFVQLKYGEVADAGYGGRGGPEGVDTTTPFVIRQYYFTYSNEALNTSVIAGKMQLDTIWTDNSIDGLVGTGVKL